MKFQTLISLIGLSSSVLAKDYIVCTHNTTLAGNSQTFEIGDFKGFFLKDSDEVTADALRNTPGVQAVEEDQVATADYGWGLDRTNQVHLPLDSDDSFGCDGAGVDAYILDTGIRVSHEDFEGRAIWGTNTVGDGIDSDCQAPVYHGTHVASTVGGRDYGIAKSVDLIAVKVLGCGGSGTYSGIIAGIEWAVARMGDTGRRSLINMSLGGGYSGALNAAVASATSAGMHVVVAAGNSNANACGYSPASAPSAVTVGSTTITDSRSSFSNWGSCLDLFAPGSNIPAADGKDDTSSHTLSGTSMASPHVAGVAALLLEQGPYTPAALTTKLISLATDGKVVDPVGSPNELLYMECEVDDSSSGNEGSESLEYPELFYCPSQSYQAIEGTVASDSWCQGMCNQPVGYAHCPSDLCECAGEDDIPTDEICESPRVCGSGEYVANPGTTANDEWCNNNCNNEWWVNCPCTLCMCAETSPCPSGTELLVLNFDDLDGNVVQLPSGYQGFTWSQYAWYIHEDHHPGSGYDLGTTSSPNTLFPAWAYPFEMSVLPGSSFHFLSGNFTSAWDSTLLVDVRGFKNNVLLFHQVLVLNNLVHVMTQLDMYDVDKVSFDTQGSQFVADDLHMCVSPGHGSGGDYSAYEVVNVPEAAVAV